MSVALMGEQVSVAELVTSELSAEESIEKGAVARPGARMRYEEREDEQATFSTGPEAGHSVLGSGHLQ
ncbi:MAG: hypothetical protein ABI054_09045 [Planctomycetota bacterium]